MVYPFVCFLCFTCGKEELSQHFIFCNVNVNERELAYLLISYLLNSLSFITEVTFFKRETFKIKLNPHSAMATCCTI